MSGPEILSGWKEIANHLRKGVRTVQRYERDLALPVRRPAGHQKGSVIATKAELDAWVSASPVRQSFPVSPVTAEHSAALKELKLRIAEMRRLRHETEELRDELRATCDLLGESLRMVLPKETQGRLLSNVLSFDVKRRVQ